MVVRLGEGDELTKIRKRAGRLYYCYILTFNDKACGPILNPRDQRLLFKGLWSNNFLWPMLKTLKDRKPKFYNHRSEFHTEMANDNHNREWSNKSPQGIGA